MLTTALAAIAAFEVVFLGEDDKALGAFVVIFRVQVFIKHVRFRNFWVLQR